VQIVGSLIGLVLWLALVLLIARFVLDWVQLLARGWRPSGIVAVLCEVIYTLTDPPLRLVRGLVPPIRLGGAALDLSPMILIIVIYLLQIINGMIFF
jgi:YggT family protein